MGKLKGSKCVSIYLYPEDKKQFTALREQINKDRVAAGKSPLKKNETWRLIIKLAAKCYEMGGENEETDDT